MRSDKYFEEIDKLKQINNTNNQIIQELKKENEKYIHDYEENRIETEEKIKKSMILNDKLI